MFLLQSSKPLPNKVKLRQETFEKTLMVLPRDNSHKTHFKCTTEWLYT